MGRVLELIVGDDSIVRSIKLKKGDQSEGIYPICHLYPLVISVSATNEPETTISVNESIAPAIRPVRRAAKKCRERLREYN